MGGYTSAADICLLSLRQRLIESAVYTNTMYHIQSYKSSYLTKCTPTFIWHSQNAEKVAHIKGRQLDQAVILFNCIPFQNGNFS